MNFLLKNKIFISLLIQCFIFSFSQIMLQRSVAIGLSLVLGVGLNSPTMLLGATVAVISALLSARFFKYDRKLILSGFYGYNAALTGTAVLLFLPLNIFSLFLAIILGAASTVIMHMLVHKRMALPVFTTPFIILTWLLLLLIHLLDLETVTLAVKANTIDDYYVLMRGVGQIIFQDYWLSGAVIFVGLLLYSYKVATWAIIGSLAGVIIARMFDFPEELTNQGLYGFNASLTAIVLAEWFRDKPFMSKLFNCKHFSVKFFIFKQWPIFIGIVISIVITHGFVLFSLPGVTAPFVLASWLVMTMVKTDLARTL